MTSKHEFWTVQVDTERGMPYYKHFMTKWYAQKMFKAQCDKLDRGCVTLSKNYEFVKEFVKE
jgi:hypothetical protein